MSRRRKRKTDEDALPKMERCPACDRAPCWRSEIEGGVVSCWVVCPSCGANTGKRAGLKEAVAAWNMNARLIREDMSTFAELEQEGVRMGGINIREVSEVTKMLERKRNQDVVCFTLAEFQSVLEVMRKVRGGF